MIRQLQSAFEQASKSVAGLSPRERALGMLMGLLGAFYVLIVAFDHTVEREGVAADAVAERLEQQSRLKELSTDRTDETVQRALVRAQAWAFSASTASIARLEAQAMIEAAGAAEGIANLRVSIDPPPVDEKEALYLRAVTIEGRFEWHSFLSFCRTLAAARQGVYFDSVSVEGTNSPKFRIVAFVLLSSRRSPS